MSCAPNSAQKFTQVGDKSHHRDAFRSNTQSPAFRSERANGGSEREFHEFNRPPGAEWNIQNPEWQLQNGQTMTSSPAGQIGVPGPNDAWVTQFQSMSVEAPHAIPQMAQQGQYGPPVAQGNLQNPMTSHFARNTPFSSFAPRFAYAEAPQMPARAAPQAPIQKETQNFDNAFMAAEHRMNALTGHMNPESEVHDGSGVDLQGVAKGVLNTVENTVTSDKMAEKMRNSNFMNLMLQLSTKQAVVKENDIVVNNSETTAPNTDWQGPKVAQVEIKQPLYNEKFRNPIRGQQPQEGVEDYLQRLGTPEKHPETQSGTHHESGILSPFAAANELGPEPVSMSNWEEDYSQWVHQ